MKRSFLTALGIEKEVMQQILDEHGATVELLKEKANEDFDKRAEKLQKTIDDLQSKVDSIDPDSGEWKEKHDMLKKEFDDFKAGIETEKTTMSKRTALHAHLKADGANEKLIELLESKFDFAKLELEGEKIKGWEDLAKPVKEQFSEVFGTVEERGANPAVPPKGGNTNSDPFLDGFNEK